jgi:hypothetical protein
MSGRGYLRRPSRTAAPRSEGMNATNVNNQTKWDAWERYTCIQIVCCKILHGYK